ncbi:hypothetical protein [Cyclobacterium jeungdonense]|uniref:Uncharacterized protein n=1 Tax=Cyclobacterium jeungdonense TaxID=708087 RepID=A0ABT8CAM8_9BACT|nr:hypothetical protein [Cyclobacterium jeungdonense]MDN3689142.1 hypothetical protein [Cyclobacterium jeungdonense]
MPRKKSIQAAAPYQEDGIPLSQTTRLQPEKVGDLILYLIRCEDKKSPHWRQK